MRKILLQGKSKQIPLKTDPDNLEEMKALCVDLQTVNKKKIEISIYCVFDIF